MFIWQNKKHELCVTFNNNKPVDNPDFILNEQSAKIIQKYINDNKPACSHVYVDSYDAVNSRLMHTCKKCGQKWYSGLKDMSFNVSNMEDVDGITLSVSYLEDPAVISYKCTYQMIDNENDILLSDTVIVDTLPEPTGDGWKFYSFSIPFHDYSECISATLIITVSDKWRQSISKKYELDVQPHSRKWVEVTE